MSKIDTLVDDIYKTVDKGVDGELEEQLIADFLEQMEFSVRRQLEAKRREERHTLRMSNIGWTDRKLWYEVNGNDKAEGLTPDTRIKFLFGDMVECLTLLLVKLAGHTVTHEQGEIKVNDIVGHADCKIDGIPVDVKSASTYSYHKFAKGDLGDDPFGYIGQISGYAEGFDADEAGFLVMDKTLGKMTYMPVDEMDMINVPVRIEHLKNMVESADPPKQCYEAVPDGKSGNMKLPIGCSYCKHKVPCWDDANDGKGLRKFIYSTGPRWLTEVEREPDVLEV